nr:MAG TPA: hypothetical protein [Bacteriophage sp.]
MIGQRRRGQLGGAVRFGPQDEKNKPLRGGGA